MEVAYVRATYYGIDDGYGPEDTMASGQPFDPYGAIAASNLWPLRTWLRVSYLDRSVDVQVLDRCDICNLDLSYGAFGQLTEHSAGVINVSVEVLR